jgi:hypothetical protein
MFCSGTTPNPLPRLLTERKIETSHCKTLFIVLIAFGILSLGIASAGMASFGAHQAWWPANGLTALNQMPALILMTAGAAGSFLFFVIGIVGLVRNYLNPTATDIETQLPDSSKPAMNGHDDGLTSVQKAQEQAQQEQPALNPRDPTATGRDNSTTQVSTLDLSPPSQQPASDNLLTSDDPTVVAQTPHSPEQPPQAGEQSIQIGKSELKKQQNDPVSLSSSLLTASDSNWAIVSSKPWTTRTWDLFTYEQIADQKYRAVLEEYRVHLTLEELQKIQDIVGSRLKKNPAEPMSLSLQKILEDLKGANPRRDYRDFVQQLRTVILSNDYCAFTKDEKVSIRGEERAIVDFIRHLCLIRWGEVNFYRYLKEILHLTLERDQLPTFDLGTYPTTILHTNEAIEKSSRNKKPKKSLYSQQFRGTMGWEDFCGNQNIPHMRNTQTFKNEQGDTQTITYVRHGTPLAPNSSSLVNGLQTVWTIATRTFGYDTHSTEEVTADYHEYLKALKMANQSVFFCVYQRRSQNVLENERTRALKTDELQKTHSNIFVLTQSVEGDLFDHQGKFANMFTFAELKDELIKEFFNSDPDDLRTRVALPLYLRNNPERKKAYRGVFCQLLEDVHALFFPGQVHVVDRTEGTSLTNITTQLTQAYTSQQTAVRQKLTQIDLATLEVKKPPSIPPEEIITPLLDDKNLKILLINKLKNLSFQQLALWVADLDTSQSVDQLLSDPTVCNALFSAILSQVAATNWEEDKQGQTLEKEQASLLVNWQSFILLFYAFQKTDLKIRLNGVNEFKLTAFTTPCKDFLDRGGNQAFVEDRLHHYMSGEESNSKRMEQALCLLLGPPIAVKKIGVIPKRVAPGLAVEKLFSQMSDSHKKRLRAYTFGEERWKLLSLRVPSKLTQTGAPSITGAIQNAITTLMTTPDLSEQTLILEIQKVLQKYGRANNQWTSVPFPPTITPLTGAFLQVQDPTKQHLKGDLTTVDNWLSALQAAAPVTLKALIGEKFDTLFTLEEISITCMEPKFKKGRVSLKFSSSYQLQTKTKNLICQFSVIIKATCTNKKGKISPCGYIHFHVD